MAYYYCNHCGRVYKCGYILPDGVVRVVCETCPEPCGMRGKMWTIKGFTFKEDDHTGLCPECNRTINPEEERGR
jgi:hypothetical protein